MKTGLEVQHAQKLSQSMQRAIALLSMDLDGLSEKVRQAVEENPALEYVPPQKSARDFAIHLRTHYRRTHAGTGVREDMPATEDATLEDLKQQLHLSDHPEDVKRLAECILDRLTPRGYFAQDLGEFADEYGVSYESARLALKAVQSLDPPGVGARTVEECLELQLREQPDVDPLCYDLIRLYLLEIGKNNLKLIAKETGAGQAHIRACVETIRKLKPGPCSLREEEPQYVMPEFSVETGEDGQLNIVFHNDYYPGVRRDDTFRRLSETLPQEDQAYARKELSAASQFIRAIEMRQSTMERLAQIIVREQRAFFRGVYSLVPLRIDDVAHEMGLHEATVYRAIQNKYLYCSRGVYPLSHFFQRELNGGSSAAAVKEMIAAMCREQGRMFDREIAEALEKRGVKLSRRTVAKYRAQMDIDSSFHRTD